MKDDDDEVEAVQVTRYPVMPSLVTLQQMKNRLHLAKVGRKLMKWTAMATGAEARRNATQLQILYEDLNEEFKQAYIVLARSRFYNDNLNKMVLENCNQYPKKANVCVSYKTKPIPGCKQYIYEVIQAEKFEHPYEHLAIEKGGQTVQEAKDRWYELLKKLILILQVRLSFRSADEANKAATKRAKILRKYLKYTNKELKTTDDEVAKTNTNTQEGATVGAADIKPKQEQETLLYTKTIDTEPTRECVESDDAIFSNFNTNRNVPEDSAHGINNNEIINEKFYEDLTRNNDPFCAMDYINSYQTCCYHIDKILTDKEKASLLDPRSSVESNDCSRQSIENISFAPYETCVTRNEAQHAQFLQEEKRILTIFNNHLSRKTDCQLYFMCEACKRRKKLEKERLERERLEKEASSTCESCGKSKKGVSASKPSTPPPEEVCAPPVDTKPSIFLLIEDICELCKSVIQKSLLGYPDPPPSPPCPPPPKRYFEVLAKPRKYYYEDDVCSHHNARTPTSRSVDDVCNSCIEIEKKTKVKKATQDFCEKHNAKPKPNDPCKKNDAAKSKASQTPATVCSTCGHVGAAKKKISQVSICSTPKTNKTCQIKQETSESSIRSIKRTCEPIKKEDPTKTKANDATGCDNNTCVTEKKDDDTKSKTSVGSCRGSCRSSCYMCKKKEEENKKKTMAPCANPRGGCLKDLKPQPAVQSRVASTCSATSNKSVDSRRLSPTKTVSWTDVECDECACKASKDSISSCSVKSQQKPTKTTKPMKVQEKRSVTSGEDLCEWHSGKKKKCKICTNILDKHKKNQSGNCPKCVTSSKSKKPCPGCASMKNKDSSDDANAKCKHSPDKQDGGSQKSDNSKTGSKRECCSKSSNESTGKTNVKSMSKCKDFCENEVLQNLTQRRCLRKYNETVLSKNPTVNDLKRIFCSEEYNDYCNEEKKKPNDLISLASCLTQVMATTKYCQNKGLLSPSTEAFYKSCENFIRCIKQKEEDNIKNNKIKQLKNQIRILEKLAKSMAVNNPELGHKINKFYNSCLAFESKIDSNRKCQSNHSINSNQGSLFDEELENAIELSSAAHKDGLMPAEMTMFMKCCASIKEVIKTKNRSRSNSKHDNIKSLIHGLKEVSREYEKELCETGSCTNCICVKEPVKMLTVLSTSPKLVRSTTCDFRKSSQLNTSDGCHIDSCVSLGAQSSSIIQCSTKASFSGSTSYIQSNKCKDQSAYCKNTSDIEISNDNNLVHKSIDKRFQILFNSTDSAMSCCSGKTSISTAMPHIYDFDYQNDDDNIISKFKNKKDVYTEFVEETIATHEHEVITLPMTWYQNEDGNIIEKRKCIVTRKEKYLNTDSDNESIKLKYDKSI